jgi:hypothetical protein
MLCCKAVYGSRLWRPVLILEFARLVQQSLGTSALFLSDVFVIIILLLLYIIYIILRTTTTTYYSVRTIMIILRIMNFH